MTGEIALFAGVGFAAMLVQSFVGFGAALVAMPLLSLGVAPQQAIPAFAVMVLAMDVMLALETRAHVDWRRVGLLLVGSAIGVPLGVTALKMLPAAHVRLAVNAVVLLFAILLWRKVELPLRDNRRTQVLVGATSGVLGGWISTSGPPVVIFGLTRGWPKDAFRGTLLAFFAGQTFLSVVGYAAAGLLDGTTFLRSGAAFAAALPAAWLGLKLKNRTGQKRFARIVLAVITLVAIVGLATQVRGWFSASPGG